MSGALILSVILLRPLLLPLSELQDEKARILDLIERLGAEDPGERERAEADLRKIGLPAEPFLRQSIMKKDPEAAIRIRQLLYHINWGAPLVYTSSEHWPESVFITSASAPQGRTLHSIFSSGYLAAPIWSRKSGQLAFYHYTKGIHLMDLDGRGLRTLGAWHVKDTRTFRWSPDGAHLLFMAESDENGPRVTGSNERIYVVDVRTGRLTCLTPRAEQCFSPAWSPDGKKVVFVSNVFKGPNAFDTFDLFVVSVEGGKATRLTQDFCVKRNPVWSPDGTRIAFEWEEPCEVTPDGTSGTVGDCHLGILDLATKRGRRIVKSELGIGYPRWSPEGGRLAYRESTGDGYTHNIWVVSANGGKPAEILSGPGRKGIPEWSPDGTRLAFHWERPKQKPQIFIIRADGTDLRQVTNYDEGARDPSWVRLR